MIAEGDRIIDCKRAQGKWGGWMEIFCLAWMMVTQIYIIIKTHQCEHINSVHFIVCYLYVNNLLQTTPIGVKTC